MQAQLAQAKASDEEKARSLSLKTDDHARERAAWQRDAEELDRERRARTNAVRDADELREQLHKKKIELVDLEESAREVKRKHDHAIEAISEDARLDKKKLDKEITVLKEELEAEVVGRKRDRDEADKLKVSVGRLCFQTTRSAADGTVDLRPSRSVANAVGHVPADD